MNNKLYVFLGTYCELIDYAILEKKYYKSDISVSNSEFERMLFQGFLNIGCESIMLSAPSVGMWPISCKKILFNEKHRNKNYITCPHLTIYGIKNFSKSISLKKAFIKIVKENLNKEIVVVGCEAHKPYLKILKYAKTKYKFKTCLIVPDLPDNMISSKNRIYTFFKKINVKNIYKLTNKYVDCFYFFTPTMCESFDLSNTRIRF